MNKELWGFALSAAFLIPAVSPAQGLEHIKNLDVGDKLTYNYFHNVAPPLSMVEEVVEVTDAEIRMTQRVGDRTYQAALSARDLFWLRGFGLSTSEAGEWSPAWAWADFPLKNGKAWSRRMTANDESFISEIAYEMKVDGVERITTPAGEFEAYRVSGSETISSRGKTGAGPYNGKAWLTIWVTSVKGKPVFVKFEYQNTFGMFSRRELVAADLK